MKVYFGLTAVALGFAALCGAALSFDGSTYLYAILETHSPHAPNGRLINVLLQWPILIISNFTSNMVILRAVFGLVYAAIPFVALALSWWVVRERAPHLFVWPALSIGLGTLPGQFYLISEGIYVAQLAWPIILSISLRIPKRHIPLLIALTIAIVFAHPFALALIAFAAVEAFAVGAVWKDDRRRMWQAAVIFCGVLAISVLKFAILRTGYETEQLSLEIILRDFNAGVVGLPLKALVATGVATLMVFATRFVIALARRGVLFFVLLIELTAIFLAGLLLVIWANDARNWVWASGFRSFALGISLLFMILASIESALGDGKALLPATIDRLHRIRIVQVVGTLFCLVLCAQSVTWLNLTNQLRETMFSSSWSCTSMASINWISTTPLSWSTPIYALLIQDKSPERLILPENGCNQLDLTAPLRLTEFDKHDWSGGWFNLAPLKQRLVAEQNAKSLGCWFAFASGWYGAQSYTSDYWWRWSAGHASLRVVVDRDTRVSLQGEIESIQQPNTVDVLVNGNSQASLNITWKKMGPLQLPALPLHAGENTIELASANPSIVLTAGDRPLAIAVANLSLTTNDGALKCDLRP